MSLANAKILVTGATGFIGSRLVQHLHEIEGAQVVAFVHQFMNASRIARLPVEMRRGDMLDVPSLRAAMQGCTHVVHAAVSFAGSANENRRVTVKGAKNICQVARELGVQRLVNLSTISVYGNTPPGPLTERTSCRPSAGYGRDKLDAETVFAKAHGGGLTCVTLRLPVVYGPWSFWSSYVISQLERGRVILPNDGTGYCSALYVDDAVRAVVCGLTAAATEQPVTCLVSGADSVTWREYYEGHGGALSGPVMVGGVSVADLQQRLKAEHRRLGLLGLMRFVWSKRSKARVLLRFPVYRAAHRFSRPLLKRASFLFAEPKHPVARTQDGAKEILPDPAHIELMASRSVVDISLAQRAVGFKPRVEFREGVARTVAWARWAGLGVSSSRR